MATTAILPSQPVAFSLTLSPAISSPFNLPTVSNSILPVINVTATYASGATGTLTVTGSTDGGSTFSPVTPIAGSPASLTASGTISVLQQPGMIFRVERAGGTGSISVSAGALMATAAMPWNGTVNVSGPLPPFNMPLTEQITVPLLGGFVIFTSGAGSVILTASTDGGQTFAPVTDNGAALPTVSNATAGQTGSFGLLQQPGTIYRLEVTFTSPGSLYYLLTGGGTPLGSGSSFPVTANVSNVPAIGPYQRSMDQGFGTAAQVQKLYDTMRVPLADADLSGTITTYKAATYGALAADGSYTPAGTAIVKLSTPAAAQRAKQRRFVLGLDRLIRAEYADVVSVVDETGNALSAAYSFVDPPGKFIINGTAVAYAGTSYAPGARVTLRDQWVSGTLSGASPTSALILPSTPTSTPAAFELRATGALGGVDTLTLTASTDGGATYSPVPNAMLAPYFGAPFAPVSPAVIPLNGTLRILRQANTLYRLERNAGNSPVAYYVGLLSSDWQHRMSNGAPVFGSSTGAFTAALNASGIQCQPTLIEAAGCGLLLGQYAATKLPDLTALGA